MSKAKIKISWVQILWGIAALIMFAAAALSLATWNYSMRTIAVPLGIAMFSAGWINLFVYHKNYKKIHGCRWVLADGLCTTLLSVFLLFNRMVEAGMIPFFFGVWELFTGVLKIIDSRELRDEKIRGWHSFGVVGAIEIISGIASLLKPVDEFVGMHGVVAFVLFVQACGFLFKILIYHDIVIEKVNEPETVVSAQ